MFSMARSGKNGGMKTLISADMMTEPSRQALSQQLVRVIAINLTCLVAFVAFCAIMSFGSLSQLPAYWNEHRAASMVASMIAIVLIPGLVNLVVSRPRL